MLYGFASTKKVGHGATPFYHSDGEVVIQKSKIKAKTMNIMVMRGVTILLLSYMALVDESVA